MAPDAALAYAQKHGVSLDPNERSVQPPPYGVVDTEKTSSGKPSGMLNETFPARRVAAKGRVKAQLKKMHPGSAVRKQITGDPELGIDEASCSVIYLYQMLLNPESYLRELLEAAGKYDMERLLQDPEAAADAFIEYFSENRVYGLVERGPAVEESSTHRRVIRAHRGPDIKVNPMIVGKFGADFDGDTMLVSFLPAAWAGTKGPIDYLVGVGGDLKIDEEFFAGVRWAPDSDQTATILRKLLRGLSVNGKKPNLTGDLVQRMAERLTSGMEGDVTKSLTELMRLIRMVARGRGDTRLSMAEQEEMVSQIIMKLYRQNKAIRVATVVIQGYAGWDPTESDYVRPRPKKAFDGVLTFDHLATPAQNMANIYDLLASQNAPITSVSGRNAPFRMLGLGKNIRKRADLVGGQAFALGGNSAEDLFAMAMSGVEVLDESAENVSTQARTVALENLGRRGMATPDSGVPWLDWKQTFIEVWDEVAFAFQQAASLVNLDGSLSEYEDIVVRYIRQTDVDNVEQQEQDDDFRTAFFLMNSGYTMKALFGNRAPRGWSDATLAEFVRFNKLRASRQGDRVYDTVEDFIMGLADLRTSSAAQLSNILIKRPDRGNGPGIFDRMIGPNGRSIIAEAITKLAQGEADQRDVMNAIEVFYLFGGPFLEAIGVISPNDFLKDPVTGEPRNKIANRFANARSAKEIASIFYEMVARARLSRLFEQEELLESEFARGRIKSAEAAASAAEREMDALASSSVLWRVLIARYKDGKRDFEEILFNEDLSMDEKERRLASLVRNHPLGMQIFDQYQVPAELIAPPLGQYGDRFGNDLGHATIRRRVDSATRQFRQSAKDTWKKWSAEVDTAEKRHKGDVILTYLKTVARSPWMLVDIGEWMLADAILSTVDPSYASTEKAQQEAAVNYLYSAVNELHNSGIHSDLRMVGDLLFGQMSAERFGRMPGFIARVLSDPDFSVTVYTGRGDVVISQAALLGPENVGDPNAIWAWLKAHPRIAMSLRTRALSNSVDSEDFSYGAATETLSASITRVTNATEESTHQREAFYALIDHPGFSALVALATSFTGRKRLQLRPDMAESTVQKVISLIYTIKRNEEITDTAEYIWSHIDPAVAATARWMKRVGDEQATGFLRRPARDRVLLTADSETVSQDQERADIATKFIGRGVYARDFGELANSGSYMAYDTVYISADGASIDSIRQEIQAATQAGARIVTASGRTDAGEIQVAEYLVKQGYVEVYPGRWAHQADTVYEVGPEDAGSYDVRGSDPYALAQIVEMTAGHIDEYGPLIERFELAQLEDTDWPFKLDEPASLRAYHMVEQALGGAKTSLGTSVNAGESSQNAVGMLLAYLISPPCGAAPVEVDLDLFLQEWETHAGKQVRIGDRFVPVSLTTLPQIDQASQSTGKVLLEEPHLCLDPLCPCSQHATDDASTNFGEQQSLAIGRFFELIRSLSSEKLNLKVKTKGVDGRDSVIKIKVFDDVFGKVTQDLIQKTYEAEGIGAARLQLAGIMLKLLKRMDYGDVFSEADLVNVSHLLIREFEVEGVKQIKVLSVLALSARVTYAVEHAWNSATGVFDLDMALAAIRESMTGPFEEISIEEVVSRVGVLSSVGSLRSRLTDQRRSSIGRNYDLITRLISINEVKPVAESTIEAIHSEMILAHKAVMSRWSAQLSGPGKFFLTGVVGAGDPDTHKTVGFKTAWVIATGAKDAVEYIVRAYELGITVLLDGDIDLVDWDAVIEGTDGVINDEQSYAVGTGRNIIPMFDIHLNGRNQVDHDGAAHIGVWRGDPASVLFIAESVVNAHDLGDGELAACRSAVERIPVSFSGLYSVKLESLLADFYEWARDVTAEHPGVYDFTGANKVFALEHQEEFTVDGVTYRSLLSALLAELVDDPAVKSEIARATPAQAEKLFKQTGLAFSVSHQALIKYVRAAYPPGSKRALSLISTGDGYIQYTSESDTYLGYSKKAGGKNMLGRVLMMRRDELMSVDGKEIRRRPTVTEPTKKQIEEEIVARWRRGEPIPLDGGVAYADGSPEQTMLEEGVDAYVSNWELTDDNGVLRDARPGQVVGWLRAEFGGEYRYHPIRLFERGNTAGAPETFSVDSLEIDESKASLVASWSHNGDLLGRSFKFFEMNYGSNKYMVRPDAIKDIILDNGVPLFGLLAIRSTRTRRFYMKRPQKLATLMFMARISPQGYNLAADESVLTGYPEIRDAILYGESTVAMFAPLLSEDGQVIQFFPPEKAEMNALVSDMVRKALRYGVDPTVVLASHYFSREAGIEAGWAPSSLWFNFQMLFENTPYYQDQFMRLFHYMIPDLVPDGLWGEPGTGNTLFNEELQVRIPYSFTDADGNLVEGSEWANLYGGFHFFDEHFSGYSAAGTQVSPWGIASENSQMAGRRRLSAKQLEDYLQWGRLVKRGQNDFSMNALVIDNTYNTDDDRADRGQE
jgi:predicted NAD-dependent protein-ADP-ribosyltransferase YbiA (DUF1768 family)